VLNHDTDHEQRRPFEVFINSKNMDHFQWIVALTRIMSAVFRKGGDITFLVEELRSVFDPSGGYFKKGGKFMPSLVAEIGDVVESHLKMIGMIKSEEISEHQQQIMDEKRAQFEGEKLAKLHKNIVVKIPMIPEGIKAIKYFSDKGIRTNCTLIFSAGQALVAAKAGATYVSPFIGRLDDISTNGLDLINQIRVIYDNYMFDTQILAASVRHPMHIIECAEIGADVMTGPLSAISALMKHPLTDSGLATFLADHKKVNG